MHREKLFDQRGAIVSRVVATFTSECFGEVEVLAENAEFVFTIGDESGAFSVIVGPEGRWYTMSAHEVCDILFKKFLETDVFGARFAYFRIADFAGEQGAAAVFETFLAAKRPSLGDPVGACPVGGVDVFVAGVA